MKITRLIVAATLAAGIASPTDTTAQNSGKAQETSNHTKRLPVEGALPTLAGATGWINSSPLNTAGRRINTGDCRRWQPNWSSVRSP